MRAQQVNPEPSVYVCRLASQERCKHDVDVRAKHCCVHVAFETPKDTSLQTVNPVCLICRNECKTHYAGESASPCSPPFSYPDNCSHCELSQCTWGFRTKRKHLLRLIHVSNMLCKAFVSDAVLRPAGTHHGQQV